VLKWQHLWAPQNPDFQRPLGEEDMLEQERRERDGLVEIMSSEMEGLYGRLAVSHM
jgi:hypothetical protein